MASGQVEKNVQDARLRLWQPTPNFPDLAALNAWLEQRCMELWREIPHGTRAGSIADAWAEEQAALMALPPAFDGFVEQSKRVSPTCLISFERNRDTRTGVIRQSTSQPQDLSRTSGRHG